MKAVAKFEAAGDGLTPEAKRLLDRFEVVAGAPGGGKRLRELILELAVRGRLVAQNVAEEPAAMLLSKAAVAKARLIAGGVLRAVKTTPSEVVEPYSVPSPKRSDSRRGGARAGHGEIQLGKRAHASIRPIVVR